ncbi:type I-C CRISPR-associated protein Cas8c/Csd1 [Streptomyces acidiscabies]|uniref:Type I-C CRISPR-associated protein Cas8c/Csd1 n=1 Tax=Streptomyces acidiscabies TaxID=42234 RepID=A0AAP6BJ40_9ACTN|nr:type I-C CRISPR-associated protein Cas8c/Csd1 [Streptomyces acidiscabies]MBZ3916682.1 type I-C CRISPR-associated protein Cas8c/Csd1 [Streptomyces acidiscabies]MDX2965682.1 type I-C CRISPR-associated protein Cas8c/Csd1 [Streptomyces acidiscabies]MDX3024816.1 type I-C CRISPR-associated protein Cas8c/Csd1 [Streptomyces acidiscabies]MDX3795598.1 type I-C CRISPR-associated protein Cas8c/Csd1 [Streptomyces acidiscabies]
MNLARLVRYATDRNLAYGWRRRRVPWVLDITDPHAPAFTPYGETEEVPYVRRSGTGSAPRPGCDNLEYLMGRHKDAWRDQIASFTDQDDGPAARDLRAALDAGVFTALAPPPGSKPADLVVLRARGGFLHNDPGLRRFWQDRLRAGLDSGLSGVCLGCGGTGVPLARLVPAYLPPSAFGQSGSGDLAMYPSGPERSGSRSGAASMPVCLDCACALGAALPSLAGGPGHHHRTREGKLLLWWGLDGAGDIDLSRLLTRPDRADLDAVPSGGRMCVMLLQPVNGRISPIWYLDEPTQTVLDRIRRWYDRTGVLDGWSDTVELTGIPVMHAQLERWNPATKTYKSRPSLLPSEADLWETALSGQPRPGYANTVLIAIRGDGRISTGRTALLQYCQSDTALPAPGNRKE